MTFKELKPGYPVYILNKTDVTSITGKVESVSLPHIDTNIGAITQMVVDVVVDVDGSRTTYCMMAETDTAYQGSSMITTDRSTILREVQAMKTNSEQALGQVDAHKRTIERCKELLAEMDPEIRAKQETDERFTRIEESLAKLAASIGHLVD